MIALLATAVDAERAVDALVVAAHAHRAVRHPYLAALADGSLPDPAAALADFAHQYLGYSAHFPRYLTALISRLENPAHRQLLLANLTEESGHYEPDELATLADCGLQPHWFVGVPHPELFRRFHQAVHGTGDGAAGVLAGVVSQGGEQLEVVCWREMLLAVLSLGSPAEAVGALGLGTEAIVSAIYPRLLRAIEQQGHLHPRDTVFFPLHTLVDDAHQASLREIAIAYAASEAGRADLARGMYKALALRDSFWSWLHERARSMQPRAGLRPIQAVP
ncbi:MAG: iron-containing redox enzyme family protein [Synechococcaceae cyanobacterium]|jgi:pyrroloquinoline quinone (PQQ) biosynthesis protein C